MIAVPDAWMLVGEPEPLLVRRIGGSEFTSLTATEAFEFALVGANGFYVEDAPGNLADAIRESDGDARVIDALPNLIVRTRPEPDQPALPSPSTERNGTGLAPRKRRR